MITKDIGITLSLLAVWVILMQFISHIYLVAAVRLARRTRRRCNKTVARSHNGYLALCALHKDHTGHCAATLPSLERIGYTMPEF